MYQVLTACGVDVDRALPWVVPWFLNAQMTDGGLNCDDAAYRCTDECPSSMVGTVAPFEAMLLGTRAGEQRAFLERGAAFLVGRQLTRGSQTVHNAEERDAAPAWLLPCFPRFYFYDVVRGIDALVGWAEASGSTLPHTAIADVVAYLARRYPDGVVRVERQAHAGCSTIIPAPGRGSSERRPATRFPLLEAASAIGEPSAAVTRQWTAARRGLVRMLDAGRLV
jgi:hypothetical protein